MKEVLIDFDNKSPADLNKNINIAAFLTENDDVEYKFMEGIEGIWKPIQDFSKSNICTWKPTKPGKYMIMVQGKSTNCKNAYDYLGRSEYEIVENSKLINKVEIDKNKINVGEKLHINVSTNEELVLYRFWIKGKKDWEILRDYTTENEFIFTATKPGNMEVLIECKNVQSERNVDDFTTVKFEVKDLEKIEITNFLCLTQNMLVNEELIFKVEANYEKNRPLLYKFLKINKEGRVTCIQDFSSKSMVTFKEKLPGEYKLLCYVRDMFSTNSFDDRAVIVYNVNPYNEVKIRTFKSDIKSPQAVGTEINLLALVDGGRELLYRYIIEGPISEDSGYIRGNEFIWEPRDEGKYKITIKVKDISFEGDHEDITSIQYEVYNKGEKPVRIVDVKCDKGKRCIIGEAVNIKVKTDGGIKPIYKFTIYKNGVEKESIDYGINNWINFIPEEPGEYEVDIKLKDEFPSKDYDASTSLFIEAKDYIAADIDYILLNSKETYLVGDIINIEAIVKNTKDVLTKFVTKINGYEVENTEFIDEKSIKIKPKCPGKYTFVIYAKNVKSTEEYDSKREVSIYVHEVIPVNSTKLQLSSNDLEVGKEVTFEAISEGGKEVCYEFYIMINGEWVLAQGYSRKNYYTFVPFKKGNYRVLVLDKSFHKDVPYEDYDTIEFEVK